MGVWQTCLASFSPPTPNQNEQCSAPDVEGWLRDVAPVFADRDLEELRAQEVGRTGRPPMLPPSGVALKWF